MGLFGIERGPKDLYLGKRGVHVRVLPPPEVKEGELALNVPEDQLILL
jgi:hypothetical protein